MLYIVGTSIGNIKDTSLRAVETLTEADVILAEDTRTFGEYYKRVQELYGLSPKGEQEIRSYHVQNEFEQLPRAIQDVESDRMVVLVSESGMPVVSDPGSQLVQQLNKKGIAFTVIPGATALTTSMVYAGEGQDTLFVGFLPKKESQLRKKVAQLLEQGTTWIAYESPHRINQTLTLLADISPAADVTVCRELTKKFEEVVHGKPSELQDKEYKGEITLVVRPS